MTIEQVTPEEAVIARLTLENERLRRTIDELYAQLKDVEKAVEHLRTVARIDWRPT